MLSFMDTSSLHMQPETLYKESGGPSHWGPPNGHTQMANSSQGLVFLGQSNEVKKNVSGHYVNLTLITECRARLPLL